MEDTKLSNWNVAPLPTSDNFQDLPNEFVGPILMCYDFLHLILRVIGAHSLLNLPMCNVFFLFFL